MTDAHGHGDASAIEAEKAGELDAHAHGHDAHDASGHDDDAHGGGHGDDPNAGIVMGTPPTPAWVLTATLIGLVTVIAAVLLAIALRDVPSSGTSEHGGSSSTSSEH
jgi:NADH-quinone oxidoreductase subunit L